jgi:adenosylcobinamide-GDP ribazoletransferase
MTACRKEEHEGSGLATAWRTLTVLPLPGREAVVFARALPWFPAVGLLLGTGALLVAGAVTAAGWPAGGGAAAVLWLVLATGGLHLDGLADTVDGLCGGGPAARALAIMKDSRIGAMGAAAVALALLFKAAALARLAELGAWSWLPLPGLMSRFAMAQLVCTQPYARPEGGTAAPFFAGARAVRPAPAALAALLMGLALAGATGAAALLLTMAGTAWLGRWWRRRLGGITGDTLGCACEATETALLALLAVAAPWRGRIAAMTVALLPGG